MKQYGTLLIIVLLACGVFAEDWLTEWGDYANTCCSYDTTIKPPFRLKWRAAFPGSMFKTSPVAAEGKLFVTSRMGAVMALDADTGTMLWRRDFPYAYGRNASTYAEGKLYVFNSYNNRRWPYDAVSDFRDLAGFHCLNPVTGETIWRKPAGRATETDRAGPAYAAGVICMVYARYPDTMTVCMARDAKTGDSLWCMTFPSVGTLVYGGIAAANDTLFISINGESGGMTVAVNALQGPKQAPYWQTTSNFLNGAAGRPSYRGGVVLVNTQALRASNGTPLWTAGDASCFTQELLLANGGEAQRGWEFKGCYMHVVVNGYTYSQPRGFDGGRPLGQWRQEARRLTNLATPVWSYEFNSSTCMHMVPAFGKMYAVATGDGAVYCFEPVK